MARRQLTDAVRGALSPILDRIDTRARHQAQLAVDEFYRDTIAPLERRVDGAPHPFDVIHLPALDVAGTSDADAPFMTASTCSTSDFVHPRFAEIAAMWRVPPQLHRKLWEHVFIVHHLLERDLLRTDVRGLGFGVGQEPLPALFASLGCDITATDAPHDAAVKDGWSQTGQFASTAAMLANPGLVDPDRLAEQVEFRHVDMNDIDDDLTGFDFAWSSCCFEHLGSLRHGIDFVINSTEQCLRPGGVGVHTTEFNLSSDTRTLERPELSFYRRRDLEALAGELAARGHRMQPIIIAEDDSFFGQIMDIPPYRQELHMKVRAEGFTVTSIGIVVERGPD